MSINKPTGKPAVPMSIKYAAVQPYPDGSCEIAATFPTEIQAQHYVQQHNQYLFEEEYEKGLIEPMFVKKIHVASLDHNKEV